jgi:two-component system, OmpR family, KDP operon response regulator KdpE
MSHHPNILIIDDEVQIRKLLEITLSSNDFRVTPAATAAEGLYLAANHPPDLILLDLGLPDRSGHDLLRHIREWFARPIIIISIQSSEEEIVRALDNGANDYIVKPFRTGELIARVKSALRSSVANEGETSIEFSNISIDLLARTVKKSGTPVKLTATEYALLSLMMRNEGKVLTHQYLLTQVWGKAAQLESQYLRVFVAQLRKKIETDPNKPIFIITESGIGYRFIGNSID